ncbi:MAG: ribbon-helix-helix protein, CopG family [Silvibacterium sp.]|nr:ribbon-helix-helix protein, CopG family [Silvibacterium sp.]
MISQKPDSPDPKAGSESTIRASIGFPADIYRNLEEIARRKKVSLAWVVREAAERYVADQWPLFGRRESGRA